MSHCLTPNTKTFLLPLPDNCPLSLHIMWSRTSSSREIHLCVPQGKGVLRWVLVFGGAVAGMATRQIQPDGNFTSQERDSIMLAIGLVVPMTSLVLGMPVSSAKTFCDGQNPGRRTVVTDRSR